MTSNSAGIKSSTGTGSKLPPASQRGNQVMFGQVSSSIPSGILKEFPSGFMDLNSGRVSQGGEPIFRLGWIVQTQF